MCTTVVKTVGSPPHSGASENMTAAGAAGTLWLLEAGFTGPRVKILVECCVLLDVPDLGISSLISGTALKIVSYCYLFST